MRERERSTLCFPSFGGKRERDKTNRVLLLLLVSVYERNKKKRSEKS